MKKSQPLCGVVFDWKKINEHNGLINGNLCISKKLSLFVGLGCKPMKAVVLYQSPEFGTDWGIVNVDKLDNENFSPHVYIEAIPEKLNADEQHKNAYDLWRRYRSILLGMKA